MMQMLFYRWIGLVLMGGVLFGCSEKVETEENTTVVEEDANPVDQILVNRLRMVMIPRIDFVDVSIEEATDFLRLISTQIEDDELDATKRGMSMVIRRPMTQLDPKKSAESSQGLLLEENPLPEISELRVRNVSFAAALRYICLMTNMRCEVDERLTFIPKNPKAAWDSFGSVLEEKGDTSVVSKKLSQIRLARVDFEDTSIYEAIHFLRFRSTELDVTEVDPSKKGMNFVVYVPQGMAAPQIDKLLMQDSTFEEVLKEICSKTGMRYELDQYSVILVPKDLK